MRDEDVLAVGALVLHPTDVGVDGAQLGGHVGVRPAEPLEGLLRLGLLVVVQQE